MLGSSLLYVSLDAINLKAQVTNYEEESKVSTVNIMEALSFGDKNR